MQPTADHVARAIVAACRETGEDPLRCANGSVRDVHGPTIRARHYAMHALAQVFPREVPRAALARMVGCPGSPASFWSNSFTAILRVKEDGQRAAGWWSDEAFGRAIRAIDSGVPNEVSVNPFPKNSVPGQLDSDPKPAPPPYKYGDLPAATKTSIPAKRSAARPGTLEPGGYRPAPGTYAKVLEDDADDDGPVFDHGQFAGNRRGLGAQPSVSKRQMADDLAEAARNTAKIPVPDE